MMKMRRDKSPSYLEDNREKWTQDYIKKIAGGKKGFSWRCDSKQLMEDLKIQTYFHCAFCDRALEPIGDSDEEIEHFKPKSKYPKSAYEWKNLYPICSKCNKIKLHRFTDLLLRPDDENYAFEKWFWYNPLSGEIEPKYENLDFNRADKTIELYGLNRVALKNRRRNHFHNSKKFNLDNNDLPFRFMKID